MINQLMSRDIILYYSAKRLGFGMLHLLTFFELRILHLCFSIYDKSIVYTFLSPSYYCSLSLFLILSAALTAVRCTENGQLWNNAIFWKLFSYNTFRILEFIFEIVFDHCLVLIIVLFFLQAHST